jgi:hypothetical protein
VLSNFAFNFYLRRYTKAAGDEDVLYWERCGIKSFLKRRTASQVTVVDVEPITAGEGGYHHFSAQLQRLARTRSMIP